MSQNKYSFIIYSEHPVPETKAFIAHINLNRPNKFNAVNWDMLKEIDLAISENIQSQKGKDVRALVFSGEGKHFSVGLDITSAQSIGAANDETEEDDVARKAIRINDHVQLLQNWTSSLEKCRVPTIAVVHGYCIGLGIDLSSACDIRIATKDS